jgi:hypothetical protein
VEDWVHVAAWGCNLYIKLIRRPTRIAKPPHRVGVVYFPHVIPPVTGTYFHFVCDFNARRKGRKFEKFEIITGMPLNRNVQYESVHG